MSEPTTCAVHLTARDRYDSFHPRKCGRVAVGTAEWWSKTVPVCKLHLAAAKRREQRDKAWEDERSEGERILKEAAVLGKKLRVVVNADYHRGKYLRRGIVSYTDLEDLARRLDAAAVRR